jgi:hypothetical protein
VSDESPTRATNNDIYARLDRIEDKLDRRLDLTDGKLDGAISRLDRLEGGFALMKWLGPAGVAGVLVALAKGAGYL